MASNTPEGKVKAKIKAILDKQGIYWFCPRGTALGRAGIPDFVGCFKGAFIAIEAKAGKNKPTALQDRELNDIRSHGGFSFVVNEENIKDFEPLLERISTEMDRATQLLAEDAQRRRDAVKNALITQNRSGLVHIK